jgi:hypothetical protein
MTNITHQQIQTNDITMHIAEKEALGQRGDLSACSGRLPYPGTSWPSGRAGAQAGGAGAAAGASEPDGLAAQLACRMARPTG